jgi:hypothetical protein
MANYLCMLEAGGIDNGCNLLAALKSTSRGLSVLLGHDSF